MVTIKHLVRSRIEEAAAMMARAFADDPVMQWMFQGSDDPHGLLVQFMTMTGNRSITVGHAYEVSGGGGTAFWVPPDSSMFTEAMGIDLHSMMTSAVGRDRTDAVLGALREATDFHPDEPHFYLATIGIEPKRRGSGLGAVLMDRVLRICDEEGLSAYLESSNPRNVSLYERAGFEVITEVQLPEGPVMRPMIRRPN